MARGGQGPQVIAFANLKGGVGKSTLAVNVAGALRAGRKRVALVDADPQGTAQAWAEAGGLPFDVIPGELDGDVGEWLARILALPAEIVVLDLPPMLGEATAGALAVCDLAVIPVSPSAADLRATNRAVEMIAEAREHRRDGKPRALLVPSKVDRRTAAGAEIEAVLHGYGEPVGPIVSQRIAHVDAFTAGQWVGDYAPKSAALAEVKAVAAVVGRLLRP